MNRRKASAGFTIIELLVVVALTLVLAGLLLPAMGRSKAVAQGALCSSHLRQLGIAAQLYWQDNDGRAFRYRGAAAAGGDVYWFGWMERGGEGERAFDATQGALYHYLQGRGVEICSALNYNAPHFKLKARGAAYGYGYNFHLSTPMSQPPFSIGSLKNSSSIALFADSAQVNTFQFPASPENPMIEEFYYVNGSERTAHFRHRRRANVIFCDGHAGSELPAEGSLDQRLPGEIVGRLSRELLVP